MWTVASVKMRRKRKFDKAPLYILQLAEDCVTAVKGASREQEKAKFLML